MLCGLLCIAHDGSFMAEESTKHYSAGVIIYCRSSRQWLKSSIAESLEVASNYCGELLGAVIALLILRASSHNLTGPLPAITLFCNNRGVLSHGNNPYTALPEKQKQADLRGLIKLLSVSSNITPTWEWVEGHAVERKGLQGSTLPEHLNDQVNKLAKVSLLLAIAGGQVMEGDFPFEVVKLKLLGRRVQGLSRLALESNWGYRAAQDLFHTKNIIRKEDFHLVKWDGLGATMSGYPKMYRVWLTKHVSKFCSSKVQQFYWSKGLHSSKCDSCSVQDKYTMHIFSCKDPGCNQLFQLRINKLHSWTESTLGNRAVVTTIGAYLCARGEPVQT